MAPIALRLHRLQEELACLQREQEGTKPRETPVELEAPPLRAEAEQVYLPLLVPRRFLYINR